MSSEFIHFITDNFSSGRVITVLVHTYIATLIYEIVNPIIFTIIDPNDSLKNLKINLSENKTINIGRVISDLITIILIFTVLFYLHKQKK
jgi:large-conductance mechanosensitive channel